MNKLERALLLGWFVAVLAFLVLQVSLVFGVLGTAAGVFLGLPVARTAALRARRKGTDLVRRRGVDLKRVGSSVGAHLVLLLVVVVVAALVPGLRDRFVAGVAALITAGAATVTGARLRAQP